MSPGHPGVLPRSWRSPPVTVRGSSGAQNRTSPAVREHPTFSDRFFGLSSGRGPGSAGHPPRGSPMKKLINRPEAVVEEMVEGLVALNPALERLPGQTVVVRADAAESRQQQVALISGGGS